MRLYKITTHFYGKDLDEAAMLGFMVAEGDDAVYDHINATYNHGYWATRDMTRETIIAARGDHNTDYVGEFYDQKYGWEDMGEVSEGDIAHLRALGILIA